MARCWVAVVNTAQLNPILPKESLGRSREPLPRAGMAPISLCEEVFVGIYCTRSHARLLEERLYFSLQYVHAL